jgi:hypothetical protein
LVPARKRIGRVCACATVRTTAAETIDKVSRRQPERILLFK